LTQILPTDDYDQEASIDGQGKPKSGVHERDQQSDQHETNKLAEQRSEELKYKQLSGGKNPLTACERFQQTTGANIQIALDKNDDRTLLLRSSQSGDSNNRRLIGTNSVMVSSNGKSAQRFDGQQAGNQRLAPSGQLNRSSTLLSSSAGTGGSQSGTSRAYLASDNERHKRKLAKARERRATLILGLIMAAFICSWLPFFTFYVLRAVCIVCREYMPPRFEAFIFWMGYCNSAINPIIYTIFNRDFRKAFRKILFKCL